MKFVLGHGLEDLGRLRKVTRGPHSLLTKEASETITRQEEEHMYFEVTKPNMVLTLQLSKLNDLFREGVRPAIIIAVALWAASLRRMC